MKSQEATNQSPVETPAIDPIRVEMLSTAMPVHQLAKHGAVVIRVMQRASRRGQLSLYWKVDPNPAVGAPGPLAYRLDTWVIKRRLDRMSRPIPRMIRIGDLREIARELNMGGDTNAVKLAFEQNAAAFIRAKLEYRASGGKTETLEGYFNRYNVFFRGQPLPGGRRAETVYISFNDPYFALVNESIWRPLDYGYLRTLTPGAQRLYELLSPRMFAAIKNGHSSAWIRYSDFCALAVAKRQETKRRMQIQMAAVHRSHLLSGYFAAIEWRTDRLDDGSLDWIIHYAPGRRAKAEFEAFNGLHRRLRKPQSVLSVARSEKAKARQDAPRPAAPDWTDSPAIALARRFAERRHGLGASVVTTSQASRALKILNALEGDMNAATAAIDLAAREGRRDRAGFPKHLGGVLEGGFVDRARSAQVENRRKADAELTRQRAATERERFEAWCKGRANRRISELDGRARNRLVDERLPRFVEEYRYFVQQRELRGESIKAWAEPRILVRYGHEGEPSIEEWRRLHDAQPTDTSGPDGALQ